MWPCNQIHSFILLPLYSPLKILLLCLWMVVTYNIYILVCLYAFPAYKFRVSSLEHFISTSEFSDSEGHMQCFTLESTTPCRELPDGSVYQLHCTYAVGKHNHDLTYLKVCVCFFFVEALIVKQNSWLSLLLVITLRSLDLLMRVIKIIKIQLIFLLQDMFSGTKL